MCVCVCVCVCMCVCVCVCVQFEAERLVLQGRCEELEVEVRAAREGLGVALEEARGHARAEALHSMQSLRESVLEGMYVSCMQCLQWHLKINCPDILKVEWEMYYWNLVFLS